MSGTIIKEKIYTVEIKISYIDDPIICEMTEKEFLKLKNNKEPQIYIKSKDNLWYLIYVCNIVYMRYNEGEI